MLIEDKKLPPGIDGVAPVELMEGEDPEDTRLLTKDLHKAIEYITGFHWCRDVRASYFGFGVGGVVAVFLFRVLPEPGVDEWLWVVVGDLPSAYMVTDDIKTPDEALEVYCDLMSDWAEAVARGNDLKDVFPVEAPATLGNAAALQSRIETLRRVLEVSE